MAAGISAGHSLISRIADGDRQAEAEFVRQYERGVRVLVRRHCRPGDPVVDDLVQDVLSGVLERLRAGAIHDPVALPAYVQSAVVYATSAEYRRRRPMQTDAVVEQIADGETPGTRLDATQLAGFLRDVLAGMPVARDREILRRFYLEEEDKDSVCRALAIDPGHFHRVMFRARERFRLLVEQAGLRGSG
jgi:RNA polymerase sigma-70 factor (ECF subfamily)